MSKARIVVAALSLSAAAFGSMVVSEGYEPVAKPPVSGDVPTYGFGSTGPDVKAGDRIDPVRAVQRALKDANLYEAAVRRCAPVEMFQHEFDAAVQLTYNIGPAAFCNSTVAKRFNARDYEGACEAFLMWDKFKGQTLRGLTERRKRERALCRGEMTQWP